MEHIGSVADRAVKGVRGRKDAQKQEKAVKTSVVKDRLDELKQLKSRAKEAGAAYSDAIKKCAEDSGLNSSAVRRFVDAAAGDSIVERKRDAEQLSLLFDEVKI